MLTLQNIQVESVADDTGEDSCNDAVHSHDGNASTLTAGKRGACPPSFLQQLLMKASASMWVCLHGYTLVEDLGIPTSLYFHESYTL